MKLLLVLMAVPLFMAGNCGEHKSNAVDVDKQKDGMEQPKDSVPPCVRKMINEGNKESPPNGPLKVEQYLYNGRKVYLTNAPCCDQYNMLYDDSCHALCAPTGGFSGRGDGKCPDFSTTAKFVKLIWRKEAD